MIFSENRCTLFGIMLQRRQGGGELESQLTTARALAKAGPGAYHDARQCGSTTLCDQPTWRTSRGQQGGLAMATYIVLGSFTEQGIKNVMDSPKRAEAVKAI